MKTLCIALPIPLRRHFDYLPGATSPLEALLPGVRIRVPFGKRELVGIFMGYSESTLPKEKLKSILEVIDKTPIFSEEIWKLCLWAADYYHHGIGDVLFTALPVLLRRGKLAELKKNKKKSSAVPFQETENHSTPLKLNTAQENAVLKILDARDRFHVFLLDGITGSGKTEVYLQSITKVLEQKKQILVLVPEIGLTPQAVQRFRARFAVDIMVLHSSLTEKERLHAWIKTKSGETQIVIGTRSAVFSPFKNLGLIIVDEEHDLSFKQQEGFRYHARDLAIMRAHFEKIPIVLGSATPALESLYNAEQGRYHHLILSERAGDAVLPEMQVLDICRQSMEEGLSLPLLNEMKQHLEKGDQVILFLNRRGFSPILLCHGCGWMASCTRCDVRLTFHQHRKKLHCHHCDSQRKVASHCESCGSPELIALGLGTERLEMALKKHFPNYSVARIDRDTTQRKGSMEKLLSAIHRGDEHILIGTQMLAKGHHFPNVTLVAVVDMDGGFFSSDFRAMERTGQLLLQVSGRAGRKEKKGKVMIQTHHPDHPLLQQLLRENYRAFASTLLQERHQTQLPPITHMALFRAESHQLFHAQDFLQRIKELASTLASGVELLGPIPAPMPRRAGRHRVQLWAQSKTRSVLQHFLKSLLSEMEKNPGKNRVKWSLDVDPLEIF